MIIAVDFDGTLCEDRYPKIGPGHLALIDTLLEARNKGDKVILNTCRTGNKLIAAIRWCRSMGLKFDAVNENLHEVIDQYGGDCRKIYADLYIDDKNACPDEFSLPYRRTCR